MTLRYPTSGMVWVLKGQSQGYRVKVSVSVNSNTAWVWTLWVPVPSGFFWYSAGLTHAVQHECERLADRQNDHSMNTTIECNAPHDKQNPNCLTLHTLNVNSLLSVSHCVRLLFACEIWHYIHVLLDLRRPWYLTGDTDIIIIIIIIFICSK